MSLFLFPSQGQISSSDKSQTKIDEKHKQQDQDDFVKKPLSLLDRSHTGEMDEQSGERIKEQQQKDESAANFGLRSKSTVFCANTKQSSS